METSQLSEMADLKDCKMDLGNTEQEEECQQCERDSSDACFSECLDTEKSNTPIADEHKDNGVANDCASSEETDRSTNSQDDIMVKEIEKEEPNLRESTPSPEPGTDRQAQDQQVEEEENKEDNNPSILDANGAEYQEPQDGPEIEQEDNELSSSNVNVTECQEPEVDDPSAFNASGAEHDEPEESLKIEQEDNNPSTFDASEEGHQELEESPKIELESVLEQQIKELAISDASTESCHDYDRDDLSDCLQVEMAIVSSDSDAEEQWKSMFSPVVDKEEENDLRPDPSDATENRCDHEDEDVNEEDGGTLLESNIDPEDEALGETTDGISVLEQPECPTECELEDISYETSTHYRSLTKIPEVEEDLGQNPKHSLQRLSASTSELDKKLPQDYCVLEEAKSENVSIEHVDFRVARQQWQKMERQSKGQLHQASFKQGPCLGGHSFMYTPVRTLERPKRDQDSDSLSLGDFQYTQFSPCSEDSGLDDISYKSHYDEPETPVEREIRETMEREESFRRERGMSRPSSAESVQGKPRPATLMTSKVDPEERKRTFNTPEDRCRSQRSPSARTPTFSVTASPSSKPAYHEMVANNVIILEPDSYPASPRHRGKGLLSPGENRFHEWPSDMTNVIILETSNLIIRSASEFCLSTACQETQESTFHNNPFFKLRSHSTQSLVDQEIKVVRQRDEEFRRQRAQLYTKEKYDTVLVSPNLLEGFTYDKQGNICCTSSHSKLSSQLYTHIQILQCTIRHLEHLIHQEIVQMLHRQSSDNNTGL